MTFFQILHCHFSAAELQKDLEIFSSPDFFGSHLHSPPQCFKSEKGIDKWNQDDILNILNTNMLGVPKNFHHGRRAPFRCFRPYAQFSRVARKMTENPAHKCAQMRTLHTKFSKVPMRTNAHKCACAHSPPPDFL